MVDITADNFVLVVNWGFEPTYNWANVNLHIPSGKCLHNYSLIETPLQIRVYIYIYNGSLDQHTFN